MSAPLDRRRFLKATAAAGAAATALGAAAPAHADTEAAAGSSGRPGSDFGFDLDPAVRPPLAWFAGRGVGDQAGPRDLPQDRAADRIVRAIGRPRIPRRDFLVTDFGAVGDGVTDDSDHVGTVTLEHFTVTDQTAANVLEFVDDFALADVTINGSPVTSG